MSNLDHETIEGDYKEGLQVWKKIFDNLSFELKPISLPTVPELCECGRLYKDRISHLGKTMCSACYTGLSVEELKLLWGTPVPKNIKDIFVEEFCLHCKNELIACVCVK